MWEQLKASRFPFIAKNEEEAEKIMFNDSPERLILLKWIYHLMKGLEEDISVNELAEYFSGMGIIEGDPLLFVQGISLKKDQRKIWKNLFQLAGMMKCSPEKQKSFAEKFHQEMIAYVVPEEDRLLPSEIDDMKPPKSNETDWNNIINDLKYTLGMSINIDIPEVNRTALGRLTECMDKLEPIKALLKAPNDEELKKQEELGESVSSLCIQLQSVDMALRSSDTIVPSLIQLEHSLPVQQSKSEAVLQQVRDLKGLKVSGEDRR